jgi:hypothetical protein
MQVEGYKCFNYDMTNRYGVKFEVGCEYYLLEDVKFGESGFHFCKRLEDTLRYFDCRSNNFCICEVIGSGGISEGFDDYYGYYEMYSSNQIRIVRKLEREDIIRYALNLNLERVKRFIMCFRLLDSEIELFKNKFKKYQEVLNFISYYQEGKVNVFSKKRTKIK